jgi:hypothetical protein
MKFIISSGHGQAATGHFLHYIEKWTTVLIGVVPRTSSRPQRGQKPMSFSSMQGSATVYAKNLSP